MNGRPLNCRNARLAANPATARMSGAARNRGNMRHKRYAAPAPPAMYTNCLKVRGPNILSSTSMNCGTWNCIRFSYERSELENLMSGTIVLYRRLKCACANSAFLIGRSALFPATLMPAIITHSIPLENGTMVSGRDNQPTPRVFSRRGLSIRVVFDNLPRRRGLTGYICTGSRSAFRFFLRGCRRRRCSNCRNRSGGFRSRSFNGNRSFSEHLSTRREVLGKAPIPIETATPEPPGPIPAVGTSSSATPTEKKAERGPASGAYIPGEPSSARKVVEDDPYREPPA